MKVKTPPTKSARIEMLPLIDVVFLLLVVFIYAMLSMAVHKGLPVALPTSDTVQTDKHTTLSVTVKADGTVFVNQAPVPLDALAEELRRLADTDQETAVLLFADRQLPYQSLFKVLDRVQQAGLSRISLQAESGQAP